MFSLEPFNKTLGNIFLKNLKMSYNLEFQNAVTTVTLLSFY